MESPLTLWRLLHRRFSSLLLIIACTTVTMSQNTTQLEGKVLDEISKKAIPLVNLNVAGTNTSTVTNDDGEFLIKLLDATDDTLVTFSLLGYKSISVPVKEIKKPRFKVRLRPTAIDLGEISLTTYKNPRDLVLTVLSKKADNYLANKAVMTSFYRETIKKRNRNVSLAEAVVNVYKEPNKVEEDDLVKLVKSRKSTDYTRLDTIAVKLQGGPFNTLYGDVMKYPEYIFSSQMIDAYDFDFERSTEINGQNVLVVSFKQKPEVYEPLYYGKLFIDAESLALVEAAYSLDITNKSRASALFVKKKPGKTRVEPLQIDYKVTYQNQGNLWYYSYSSAELSFKVKKRRKLFNSIYTLSCEMAVTDWKIDPSATLNEEEAFNKGTILADEASGFSDPDFWGSYNVIEPEKSIESAIKKIKRKLSRVNTTGQGMGGN